MNLTGRPPYQKGSAKKKSNKATAEQIRYREEKVRPLGCILNLMVGVYHHCQGRTTIHHCGTGGGGRKDHWKIVPLCQSMHTGPGGIDGRVISKKAWQETYTTEGEMLETVERMLGNYDL